MIDALVSNPQIKMLEETMSFTEQRHQVLVEDIANVSTDGYVQKDVDVQGFQKSLQDAVTKLQGSTSDQFSPESSRDVSFDADDSNVSATPMEVPTVMFHDRGSRSMEYLMGQMADNAMAHNTAAQLLKSRYDQLNRAISMKV